MLNERNRYKNILCDVVYLIIVAMFAYVCFKLFSQMLVGAEGFKSDMPYYVRRANDGTAGAFRFVFVLFKILYDISGSTYAIAVFLGAEIAAIIFSNHLYIRYFSGCDTKDTGYRIAVHFASIAALLAGPIYVPHIHRAFYKNTFPIFAWHSPTQQMMTLFSILGVYCLFRMIDEYEEKIEAKWWIGSAVFFFLSAYSKPSFIIDIVPAVVIAFIIELFVKSGIGFGEKFKRLFIMGCSLVPSGVYMLILNYHIYEREERTGDSEIMVDSSKFAEYNHLWVAIFCCMAFAIVVMIFNWKKLFGDKKYRLIVMTAVMGLLQWGLLGESGHRGSHGNFEWGCIIGGYMLMLTCISVALENLRDKDFLGGRKWLRSLYFLILAGSLSLHLLSHLYYFYTIYNGAGYWR